MKTEPNTYKTQVMKSIKAIRDAQGDIKREDIAAQLNAKGINTSKGKSWNKESINKFLQRNTGTKFHKRYTREYKNKIIEAMRLERARGASFNEVFDKLTYLGFLDPNMQEPINRNSFHSLIYSLRTKKHALLKNVDTSRKFWMLREHKQTLLARKAVTGEISPTYSMAKNVDQLSVDVKNIDSVEEALRLLKARRAELKKKAIKYAAFTDTYKGQPALTVYVVDDAGKKKSKSPLCAFGTRKARFAVEFFNDIKKFHEEHTRMS